MSKSGCGETTEEKKNETMNNFEYKLMNRSIIFVHKNVVI